MPDPSETLGKVESAERKIRSLQRAMRETIRDELAPLDPAEPHVLAFAVKSLLIADFQPKELAQLIGVSRTTITRWSDREIIPRAPAYRKFIVQTLRGHLEKALEEPIEAISSRPLPHHATYYETPVSR